MQLEEYLDFLPNGAIRLKGHRIGIEHVVDLYHEGLGAEEIAAAFEGLSLEQVYAVLAYYLQKQADIDAYLAAGKAEARQLIRDYEARPAAPVIQRLHGLKAQRQPEEALAVHRRRA
jgi:uncharacterized protein (DUF433 family)